MDLFFSLLGLLGARWAIVVQDDRWYRKSSCKVLWKQLILGVERRRGSFLIKAWHIFKHVSDELTKNAGKGDTDRHGRRTVDKALAFCALGEHRVPLRPACRAGLGVEFQKDSDTTPS